MNKLKLWEVKQNQSHPPIIDYWLCPDGKWRMSIWTGTKNRTFIQEFDECPVPLPVPQSRVEPLQWKEPTSFTVLNGTPQIIETSPRTGKETLFTFLPEVFERIIETPLLREEPKTVTKTLNILKISKSSRRIEV